jgi:hypothetical protein
MIEELDDQDEAPHVNANKTEEEVQDEGPTFDNDFNFDNSAGTDCHESDVPLSFPIHLQPVTTLALTDTKQARQNPFYFLIP